MVYRKKFTRVSTRSRPKAADKKLTSRNKTETVSTRSRPKAADASKPHLPRQPKVSTRSRPKAADLQQQFYIDNAVRFNSQPPEGG